MHQSKLQVVKKKKWQRGAQLISPLLAKQVISLNLSIYNLSNLKHALALIIMKERQNQQENNSKQKSQEIS